PVRVLTLAPAPSLNSKALSAPAFPLHVGVAEAKGLVQALFDEIDLGAFEKSRALAVDDDFDSLVLENQIVRADLIGIVHDIGETGAPGLLHAKPEADTVTSTAEEGSHSVGSSESERNRHERFTGSFPS